MTAEYPSARWVPADRTNYREADRQTFALICIHCTDGHANPGPVAAMWQEPHHGTSAHFVIGQGGEVIQAIALKDIAYHAHAANRSSVGIEHCCRTPGELGPDDPGLPPSPVQMAASAKLVAWLCQQAGLEPTREVIVGHAEVDIATTHRGCPVSAGIDLDALAATVAMLMR